MKNRPIEDAPPSGWHIFDDADAVAAQAAQRILRAAALAIAEHGRFRLVLAGGGTPEATYRLLVGADTDWSRWEIYFGDERCLPADDAQRNSVMAHKAWLDAASIPAQNVHPIPAELGAEAAAQAYESAIEAALPFDLVLLGIGEDGHTASLFPGHRHETDELVHAVHNAPKPPPDRVSLSARALSTAREVLVLATGVGKLTAIRRWRAGEKLPIATIGAPARVDVLLDKAAQA
jgi:6-phosphogluconolactonase